MNGRSRRHSVLSLLLAGAALAAAADPALAHSPDPVMGGDLWGQDQRVGYRWKSGQVPPSWLQAEVNAAAYDSRVSRASRAAIFAYDSAGPATVSYDEPSGCGSNGIACFTRGGAPYSFTMSFRRQGYRFDWGALRWCQAYETWPDGCYDVENIALDEFGHIQILAHHLNYSDDSDYLDAVVQTFSRTKPRTGWNVHRYGRCDTATLQRKYDVPSSAAAYSTCLDLGTVLTLATSSTSVAYGGSVTFTARLRVATSSAYERLSANPVSQRTVVVQRRWPGSTTWSSIATMEPSGTGTYTYGGALSATADWRAVFRTPSTEGLNGSVSSAVRVTVAPCSDRVCPAGAE